MSVVLLQGYNLFAGFVVGLVFGVVLAVFVGSTNNLIDFKAYQQCRYFGQPVERCVEEIHYEKRVQQQTGGIDSK